MKLTIDTTEDQDAALAQLNAEANPVEETRPTLEAFSTSEINRHLDGFVKQRQRNLAVSVSENIKAVADKLTDEDRLAIQQIIFVAASK